MTKKEAFSQAFFCYLGDDCGRKRSDQWHDLSKIIYWGNFTFKIYDGSRVTLTQWLPYCCHRFWQRNFRSNEPYVTSHVVPNLNHLQKKQLFTTINSLWSLLNRFNYGEVESEDLYIDLHVLLGCVIVEFTSIKVFIKQTFQQLYCYLHQWMIQKIIIMPKGGD